MLEMAKKVITKDSSGNENGFLIELTKDGKLTTSYLSCCYPGAFKGYHLHKVRQANYVCIRGELTVIMYFPEGRKEVKLSAASPERLHIPINVPTGLRNDGDDEAWIINNPQPAYDPDLKGEQIDFTQEQMDAVMQMFEGYASPSYPSYLPPYYHEQQEFIPVHDPNLVINPNGNGVVQIYDPQPDQLTLDPNAPGVTLRLNDNVFGSDLIIGGRGNQLPLVGEKWQKTDDDR